MALLSEVISGNFIVKYECEYLLVYSLFMNAGVRWDKHCIIILSVMILNKRAYFVYSSVN